jgi:SOS-response transcriptional repressor LexA
MVNQPKQQGTWYAVISFEILSSAELSDKEKLLLALIGNLQNQKGYCYASNEYMAQILKCTANNVCRLISHLHELGYLLRQVYRNEKNQVTSRILMINLSNKLKPELPKDYDKNSFEDCENDVYLDENNAANTSEGYPPTEGYPSLHKCIEVYAEKPNIITKFNNSTTTGEIEKEKAVLAEKVKNGEMPHLVRPELETTLKIANKVLKNDIWIDQICISTQNTRDTLKSWMRIFNLHVSESDDIYNMDERLYKKLFIGWLRMKKSAGVRLSDYNSDNSETPSKNKHNAPPLWKA